MILGSQNRQNTCTWEEIEVAGRFLRNILHTHILGRERATYAGTGFRPSPRGGLGLARGGGFRGSPSRDFSDFPGIYKNILKLILVKK